MLFHNRPDLIVIAKKLAKNKIINFKKNFEFILSNLSEQWTHKFSEQEITKAYTEWDNNVQSRDKKIENFLKSFYEKFELLCAGKYLSLSDNQVKHPEFDHNVLAIIRLIIKSHDKDYCVNESEFRTALKFYNQPDLVTIATALSKEKSFAENSELTLQQLLKYQISPEKDDSKDEILETIEDNINQNRDADLAKYETNKAKNFAKSVRHIGAILWQGTRSESSPLGWVGFASETLTTIGKLACDVPTKIFNQSFTFWCHGTPTFRPSGLAVPSNQLTFDQTDRLADDASEKTPLLLNRKGKEKM